MIWDLPWADKLGRWSRFMRSSMGTERVPADVSAVNEAEWETSRQRARR